MAFDLGGPIMCAGGLLKGRNLEASARPLAPVVLHLHVYEFSDGGRSLACQPEFTNFYTYLGHLVDPQALNYIVAEILSHTFYNDLETLQFWEEKLTIYAAYVGRIALDAGVQEVELTVEIHIPYMERQLHQLEQEMAEQATDASDEETGDFGGVPASEASIKELEVVKYNGVGGEFGQNGCSICLEEFELDMEMTRMPCQHAFHGGCLVQWLEKSHLCPLCRFEIPTQWEVLRA